MVIEICIDFKNISALKTAVSIWMKKVQVSFNWAWQLYMMSMPLEVLAQNSWISGLSNEVKHISEFQALFEKIAKNSTKFASKNQGVRKLNFSSEW